MENNDGVNVQINGENEGQKQKYSTKEEITLYTIFNNLVTAVCFPSSDVAFASKPLLYRIKYSLSENFPLLQVASKNTGQHVLLWTRRGSSLRALLVVSVGTVALLALTGFLVFVVFFVAATFNAIVISLLVSLAAAGGFLAIFFAFVAAIYVGALSVAIFVISTTTISAIVAALIVTGWIGFFWTIFLGTKKGVYLAKKSLSVTGSAISAYSPATFTRHHPESNTVSN